MSQFDATSVTTNSGIVKYVGIFHLRSKQLMFDAELSNDFVIAHQKVLNSIAFQCQQFMKDVSGFSISNTISCIICVI